MYWYVLIILIVFAVEGFSFESQHAKESNDNDSDQFEVMKISVLFFRTEFKLTDIAID